jgi:prepilin-type N-terminal cleavage/methylation domain-containing protein
VEERPTEPGKKHVMHSRNQSGFTLIELMIVVAIIAIIASMAVPKLMSTRLAANEAAAISTLRSVASAQAQIQSSGAIDTDSDGGGEHAYFAELAGSVPMRIDSGGGVPAVGALVRDQLNPAILASAFGTVGAGVIMRSGYVFQMWLPDGAVPTTHTAEALMGGMNAVTSPSGCEVSWACYAWPAAFRQTGSRCFFINQEGDVLQSSNRQALAFQGVPGAAGANPILWDEVFNIAGSNISGLRIGTAGGPGGSTWVPVQ